MLVEINLLPQKEPKKFAFFIVLGVFLAVLLFAGIYYYFLISSTKANIDTVDREISMTQKVREQQEQKSNVVETTDSVSKLKTAIDWADTYPIETIPVMRHLTSLLPERGFIQSFGYTEAGTITLTVQFDSSREGAYFLNSLLESEWVEDANLSSLTAAAQNDANAAGAQAQTATTGTAPTGNADTNTTNQTNTTGTTTVQTADPATNTASQTGTQASTVPATTSATENGAVSTTDSQYLPRYTGQYEITLSKIKVKEIAQQDKKAGEGVSGS
jgi:Tfp pilus assembly protein PilN